MAAMSYTAIAPLVIAKNEAGADLYVYKDGAIPAGQSAEWIKTHLDSGMIAASGTVETPDDPDAQPAGNAGRDAWAAYALANGYSEEDIEGKSRDDLRGLFSE